LVSPADEQDPQHPAQRLGGAHSSYRDPERDTYCPHCQFTDAADRNLQSTADVAGTSPGGSFRAD